MAHMFTLPGATTANGFPLIEIPFNMSGWVSSGDGSEYSGTLTKNGKVVYSWNGRVNANQIGY